MGLALFFTGAGFFFGWLTTYLYWLPPNAKYQNPSLHEGNWEGPKVEGFGRQARAVWTGFGGQTICAGSNHGPHKCEIGPGTAHVDTCECGAKRYGVHGAWS